jgi:hypothetical protein
MKMAYLALKKLSEKRLLRGLTEVLTKNCCLSRKIDSFGVFVLGKKGGEYEE